MKHLDPVKGEYPDLCSQLAVTDQVEGSGKPSWDNMQVILLTRLQASRVRAA
jgi:hypothetical protein